MTANDNTANATAGAVSDEDVARFARDGAIALRGQFDAAWIELLAAGVDENLRAPGPYAKHYTPPGKPGYFFGDYCNWARIDAYRRFAFESPAGAIAARLMGTKKVNLFHEHVLVKEPGTEEPTPWHHDQPYWVVDGDQVCSLWVALDPVPREVCVEFLRGSHRWGEWFTPRRFNDGNEHPSDEGHPVPDEAALRARAETLSWDLEPGDCVAFHALTVHGAPGNRSGRRRRAVSLRLTGDDARFVRRNGLMSPPFPEVDLAPGAPLDSSYFPVIWPR